MMTEMEADYAGKIMAWAMDYYNYNGCDDLSTREMAETYWRVVEFSNSDMTNYDQTGMEILG